MRMKRNLTHEEANARALEAADMILSGKTITQVTDHYGYVSTSSVKHLIENNLFYLDKEKYDSVKSIFHNNLVEAGRRNGSNLKGKKYGPKPETLKMASDIADYMIKTNCPYTAAARHFNLSKNYARTLVNRVLKENDSTKYLELMNAIERKKHPVDSFVSPKLPEDIELEFIKNTGYTEHNCRAICYYIINNNAPWKEAADRFDLVPIWTKQYVSKCASKFDMQELVDKAKAVALKGHYDGEMLENEDRLLGDASVNEWWDNRCDVLADNGLKISEYLLINSACIADAANYFGVYRNKIEDALFEMQKIHEEKYNEVMDMLDKNYPKRTKNATKQPKDNVVQLNIPDTTPLSPTLVAEPVKVAAEVKEPIVKDTEAPVIQKVCDTKIEMVAKPVIEETAAPKVGFWQRIKNWFMGA